MSDALHLYLRGGEDTEADSHCNDSLFGGGGVRCKSKKDKLELTYKDLLSVNTFQGFD